MLEFSKERASVVMSAQAQVSDARNEAEALRRLVKLKTRELKSVRRLAHEVLLQRSDVEVFLLSSLQTVSMHLRKHAWSSVVALAAVHTVMLLCSSIMSRGYCGRVSQFSSSCRFQCQPHAGTPAAGEA